MTNEEIVTKKKEIEDQFNVLEKTKGELNQKIQDILSEQLRLQGEFRLLGKLEVKVETTPEEIKPETIT